MNFVNGLTVLFLAAAAMAPRERVRRMMMGGNEETKQTFDSISSIVDAEVQRVATISTSGPAQRKRTANALNSGTVPTELLSADGARALELPKGGEPGCGRRWPWVYKR